MVCRLTLCEHTYASTYPTLKPRLVEHTRIHTKTNIIIRADVFSRADVADFFSGVYELETRYARINEILGKCIKYARPTNVSDVSHSLQG